MREREESRDRKKAKKRRKEEGGTDEATDSRRERNPTECTKFGLRPRASPTKWAKTGEGD